MYEKPGRFAGPSVCMMKESYPPNTFVVIKERMAIRDADKESADGDVCLFCEWAGQIDYKGRRGHVPFMLSFHSLGY